MKSNGKIEKNVRKGHSEYSVWTVRRKMNMLYCFGSKVIKTINSEAEDMPTLIEQQYSWIQEC